MQPFLIPIPGVLAYGDSWAFPMERQSWENRTATVIGAMSIVYLVGGPGDDLYLALSSVEAFGWVWCIHRVTTFTDSGGKDHRIDAGCRSRVRILFKHTGSDYLFTS